MSAKDTQEREKNKRTKKISIFIFSLNKVCLQESILPKNPKKKDTHVIGKVCLVLV